MSQNKTSNDIENLVNQITELSKEDHALLQRLRSTRKERAPLEVTQLTLGHKVADKIATVVGSWRFVIIQSVVLAAWIVFNVVAWGEQWDPYPFILLNLMLSFQAAYTAPVIMMSQNRQSEIDRRNQNNDYEINMKAELEIELLHHKIDLLRTREIERLSAIIEELAERLPKNSV
jgi:uncharacterized membrane protein